MNGQILLGPNGQPMPINQGRVVHPTADYRLARRPDGGISLQRAWVYQDGIGMVGEWQDVPLADVDHDGRDIQSPVAGQD